MNHQIVHDVLHQRLLTKSLSANVLNSALGRSILDFFHSSGIACCVLQYNLEVSMSYMLLYKVSLKTACCEKKMNVLFVHRPFRTVQHVQQLNVDGLTSKHTFQTKRYIEVHTQQYGEVHKSSSYKNQLYFSKQNQIITHYNKF